MMCDEEMDLDALIALQEEEERRMADQGDEDDEEDLAVLRELEASQKENRAKKALFNGGENVGIGNKAPKRTRDDLNSSAPLAELPDDFDNQEETDPFAPPSPAKSPAFKKAKKTAEEADVEREAERRLAQILERARERRVFRRIPAEGDYQAVTAADGQRFYLKKGGEGHNEDVGSKNTRNEGLCGVPYSALLESALEEQERCDRELALSLSRNDERMEVDSGIESADEETSASSLWVEKYRPRAFLELLSDDGTNRTLLHWLKLWDKLVFNRERKVFKKKAEEEDDKAKGNKFGKMQQQQKGPNLPEVLSDLDENGAPMQKIALLHGPPGLGKTTLAHVIATHAGYSVVEMNASDDRSLAAFSTRVEAATQMRSVRAGQVTEGGDDVPRPNCLIVDEIDGAPAAAVNYLVGLATGKRAAKGGKGKKAKGFLQRPIICICNDLFVPALRPLKQHCLTVPFPPTLAARLSQRLLNISRQERLVTDLSALMSLCEKTDNDIRSCLSTLQFFKIRGQSLRLSDVQKTAVGQKDAQKGHFAVWRELFETPRASLKKTIQLPGRPGQVLESAAAIPVRYYSMLHTIMACGEYEKLMNGVFEMYLDIKFKDSMFETVTKGHEWFVFFDEASAAINRLQVYSPMAFLPFAFVQSHLLFSAAGRPKLTYPHTQQERRQQLARNKQVLEAVLGEMTPAARASTTSTSLVFDVLPLLVDIIRPGLRPVNTQLYSAREKEELRELVAVMAAYNLTYVQERSPEGQYSYRLDPAVDDITEYPVSSGDHHFQAQRQRRQLPYAIKQLVAREIEMARMRREEAKAPSSLPAKRPSASTNRDNGKKPAEDNVEENVATTEGEEEKSLPNHLRQKLEAKKVDGARANRSPVDFFGRAIDPEVAARRSAATKREEEAGRIISSDIWFRFKEGYNNAVRRNIRMKDLA